MTKKQKNMLMLIVIVAGAGAVAAMFYLSNEKQTTTPPPVPAQQPAQTQSYTPQPAGDVPPGKVWAPEHGHWHDAASSGVNTATSTPGQLTPQPAGEAPPGKVWAPEHGHWHDAPQILEVNTQSGIKVAPADSQ